MTAALIALDLLLLVLSTARLARLVITDELGIRFIQTPAWRWSTGSPEKRWWAEALDCPFCIGYWIAAANLIIWWLLGGPGDLAVVWRLVLGSLALNWLVAHIGTRLGDYGYADDEG